MVSGHERASESLSMSLVDSQQGFLQGCFLRESDRLAVVTDEHAVFGSESEL